jgi:hypothetical protein
LARTAAFIRRIGFEAFAFAEAPFDEPLDVDGAALELPEAEVEGMVQVVQVKVLGAPLVRTVEERTIVLVIRHARLTRDTLRHMELSAHRGSGRESYSV